MTDAPESRLPIEQFRVVIPCPPWSHDPWLDCAEMKCALSVMLRTCVRTMLEDIAVDVLVTVTLYVGITGVSLNEYGPEMVVVSTGACPKDMTAAYSMRIAKDALLQTAPVQSALCAVLENGIVVFTFAFLSRKHGAAGVF